MVTTDERAEIEEWFEIMDRSINRIKREFDNFRHSVQKMQLTVERMKTNGNEKGNT